MSKSEIISGYINAPRPYEVAMRSNIGGYLEFSVLERLISEENARMVCDSYAETFRENRERYSIFRSVVVRKGGTIIYEVAA